MIDIPVLSVVVTVVDAGAALERCLRSLTTQREAPASMEIIVPHDVTTASVAANAREFPAVHFIDLGTLSSERPWATAGGQHELIDRRRAAGLAAARGGIVAIVEDRAVPRPDWAKTVVRLHAEMPNQVIGGAVENGRDQLLNWGVYYCDFGRYQLPFAAGPRHYVTDVNVAYKRAALEQTREIWRERYHEPLVHWALERAGETLVVSPESVVDEIRDDLTLPALLAERLAWGRLFGSIRVRDISAVRRLGYIGLSPVIPVVLFARFLREQVAKGTPASRIARVGPVVALLLSAWVTGEAMGYVTGKP